MLKLPKFDITSFLIIIVLTILIYNLATVIWKRRYLYYYALKFPGPLSGPLIGNGLSFIGNNHDQFLTLMGLFENYKSPLRIWLGSNLVVLTCKPKDYEIILTKTLNKLCIYDFASEVIGTGLLTAPAEKWKRHRKLIQPTFNQKILNSFVKLFAKQGHVFNKDLEEYVGKECFDVFPVTCKQTTTLVSATVLGTDSVTKEQVTEFYDLLSRSLDIVFLRMFKIWYHPNFIWNLSSYSKELKSIQIGFNNIAKDIISKKRKKYKLKKYQNQEFSSIEETSKWKAFLDYVIELSEEHNTFTDDEIIEETIILLIAGTDTTAATISFVLIMLGMHPNIQDKVFKEVYSIYGDSKRDVELADLNKLIYLELVIKETLRLFPIAAVIGRTTDEDIQLESHFIPKNTSCIIGILHTHRNPEIWTDPLKFIPERFLPEEVEKRHSYAFIPFSGGPRNCIGLKYSMMAMKAIISTIIRSYKISTNYKSIDEIELTQAILLRTLHGFNIRVEYRT